MTAVVIRSNRDGEGPVVPPRKPDGSMYRHLMMFDGDKSVAFADTYTDLTEVLCGPGYANLDDDAKLQARHNFAITTQVWLQAHINIAPEFDLSTLSEEEYDVLMASRDTQPAITRWSNKLPLILIRTGYAPYTDLPVPEAAGDGDLVWISPEDEAAFLTSLNYLGEVTLAEEATGDTTSE